MPTKSGLAGNRYLATTNERLLDASRDHAPREHQLSLPVLHDVPAMPRRAIYFGRAYRDLFRFRGRGRR